MSINPMDRSDEEVAKALFKPVNDLLVREDEELRRVDELIRAAERKSESMLHPES